jgi:Cys-tRNA(Pro) deacylase
MSGSKDPVTPAVRALRQAGIPFQGHPYTYVEGGGTAQFAAERGVDEHRVIKTLVMEDERRQPLIVLMHGDRKVSTKALARAIGAKAVQPCNPLAAQRHTGYQVGGTSPFGLRHVLPVFCEESIAELQEIYVNGGKRGFIISLCTRDALALLNARAVSVARD